MTSLHSEIETSDFLVLSGVGAFKNAMHEIETRNLTEAIHNFALIKWTSLAGNLFGHADTSLRKQ